MQTRIVQVGNSLGLRLPKAVLDSLKLQRSSPLSIEKRGDSIVLRPVKKTRDGWAEAFSAHGGAAEPENLWGDVPADEGWDR